MLKRLRNSKIDWANHVLGFFSALIGIYIAFRLENYREDQQEKERIKLIELAVKKEIDNNIKIYEEDIEKLSDWLAYFSFCTDHTNNNDQLVLSNSDYAYFVEKYPTRTKGLEMVGSVNDTLKIYEVIRVMDVKPTTGISTSSWKAALASGLMNSMDFVLANNLSKIYEWIEKDIGGSDREFYENILTLKSQYPDIDKITKDYNDLVKIYSFKLGEIQYIYAQIKWSNPE